MAGQLSNNYDLFLKQMQSTGKVDSLTIRGNKISKEVMINENEAYQQTSESRSSDIESEEEQDKVFESLNTQLKLAVSASKID